ncbi:hypothetical protein F4777DRAFT_553660 [Nemania sp. FL0916]|nr:hypothetical protein F4777DRAFT_553660 [Nemania sp. FL0916]
MPNYSIYDGIHGAVPSVTRGELGLISAFMTLSIWIVLEFHFHVFRTFKTHRSLYFWSLMALAWGIILHSIGYLLNWFALNCPWELYALMNAIGWSMIVTAESLVLYSRMHLVTRKRSVHRFVLGMIIFTALFVQIPNWVISIPAVSRDPAVSAVWSPRDSIETRIQQVAFLLQEGIISSLYIWYTGKILKPSLQIRQRRVMLDLVYVNAAIIILDVIVIILAFTNQHLIKEPLQNLSYALKLKLEFFVLNQLMEISGDGVSNRPGMKGRYVTPTSFQKSNEQNDTEKSGGVGSQKHVEWISTDPSPNLYQEASMADPTVPDNTYFATSQQYVSPPTRPGSATYSPFPSIPGQNSRKPSPATVTQVTPHAVTREATVPMTAPDFTARSWLHLADDLTHSPPQEKSSLA